MPASNPPLRILIVEGHEDLAVSLQGVLGHAFRDRRPEVVVAPDCSAARAMLRRREWALVLSDHGLPDGEGLDLLAEARRLRPAMPMALMTAQHQERRFAAAMRDLGLVALLEKPFPAARVVEVVRQTLALPQPGAPDRAMAMAPVAEASPRSAPT